MTTSNKSKTPASSGIEGHQARRRGRVCSVCGRRWPTGDELEAVTDRGSTAWVCDDCQQQLALSVDDDVKGG